MICQMHSNEASGGFFFLGEIEVPLIAVAAEQYSPGVSMPGNWLV